MRALLAARDGDQALLRSTAADEERVFPESGGSPTTLAVLFALPTTMPRPPDIELAFESDDAILVSPMYFFLPEDWQGMTAPQRALDEPGLRELYELRRGYIASGAGGVLPSGRRLTSGPCTCSSAACLSAGVCWRKQFIKDSGRVH